MDINGDRLLKELTELGNIGYKEGVGTSRMAYSETFNQGRNYVKQLMESSGMAARVDEVGNLTGVLKGETDKIISIGSHIDTVPGGGIYDGALGVLAGIEAVRALKSAGYRSRHSIEVIAFTEEEGNVVGGTFGSKAFTGQPQEPDSLQRAVRYNITETDILNARRNPEDYRCYLELHIEQGGRLEQEQIPFGIVQGIVGIARYRVTVAGKANHAGSTPMNLRDDALVKAAPMITGMMDIARDINSDMTCTIGKIRVEPGAVNVIPGLTEFMIELRCMDTQDIKKAIHKFKSEFQSEDITIENFLWQEATNMDGELMEVFQKCCLGRKTNFCHMPSGAGHDGINMALFTPSAMIFIPSIGGISHNIREESRPEDIIKGSNILLDAIRMIDRQ